MICLTKCVFSGKINAYSTTPLLKAVSEGHHVLVQLFLRHWDIKVNEVDSGGYTPLLLAAETGNEDIFQTLWDDARVNRQAVNSNNENALMCACKKGRLRIVEFLLKSDLTNLDHKNNLGVSAIGLAAREGYCDIVRCLAKKDRRLVKVMDTTDNGTNLLMLAISSNELDTVQFMVSGDESTPGWEEDIDFEATDNKGNTALMLAAAGNSKEIVMKLCDVGKVQYNTVNRDVSTSYTALMLAARDGQSETLKAMIQHRRNREVVDSEGNPHSFTEGFDILWKDDKGRNALFMAARKSSRSVREEDREDCVRAILEENKRRCDQDHQDASMQGSKDMVNAVTIDGKDTALTATSNSAVRRLLIEYDGFDVRKISDKQKILRFVQTTCQFVFSMWCTNTQVKEKKPSTKPTFLYAPNSSACRMCLIVVLCSQMLATLGEKKKPILMSFCRQGVRKAILEAGTFEEGNEQNSNTRSWKILLKKEPQLVLPLLVLMTEDLDRKDKELFEKGKVRAFDPVHRARKAHFTERKRKQ